MKDNPYLEPSEVNAILIEENKEAIKLNRRMYIIIAVLIVMMLAGLSYSYDRRLDSTMEQCERKLYEHLYGQEYPFSKDDQ